MSIRTVSMRTRVSLFLAFAIAVLGIAIPTAKANASAFSWTVNLSSYQPAKPTYLYPYMPPAKFTQSNGALQLGLYRPLYWFGDAKGGVNVDPAMSLAALPVMSNGGKTATIVIKPGYKWSNGAPVQAKDVMEFLNIMVSDPGAYGNYSGTAKGQPITIPDILASASIPKPNTIVLNFVMKIDPTFLVYNPLSEVTPLPQAWDVVPANWDPTQPFSATTLVSAASGMLATKPGGCWSKKFIGAGKSTGPTTTYTDPYGDPTNIPAANVNMAKTCTEVRTTMNSFGYDPTNIGNLATNTGKIWSVVDGPYKIDTWNYATGAYDLVRNPTYGGKRNAKAPTELNYIPCQSATGDCLNLLLSGTVDIAGVPSTIASPITSLSQAPNATIANAPAGYKLKVGYDWSVGYGPINMDSKNTGAADDASLGAGDTTPRYALFAQQYVRVALNDTYPGSTIVNTTYRGYGYATPGPLPPYPVSKYSSHSTNPYSSSKISALMTSHGWALNSSGIWACVTAGSSGCGTGIDKGAEMIFRVDAATQGDTQGQAAMTLWQSAAKSFGVDLIINTGTFNSVIASDTNGTTNWDMYEGSGWIYAPGFLPTGEPLWLTGAASNSGDFSNSLIDHDILGTIKGTVTLAQYAKDLQANPPNVWQHWLVRLIEVSNHIGGYVYQSTGYGRSELWHKQ